MFHQGCILPWLSKVIITLSDTCQRQWSVLKHGRLFFYSAMRYPYTNFPKCRLRCSLAQANLFVTFTVYSVPVVNLWQCIGRQLLRQSCFNVLLRLFLSSLRAEKCALWSHQCHKYCQTHPNLLHHQNVWELCATDRPVPPAPPPMHVYMLLT